MTTIGWIGTGNMASAIIHGITQKTQAYAMAAYSPHLAEKTDFPAQKLNSSAEVAKVSDVLFLAVKPVKMVEVLAEIKPALRPGNARRDDRRFFDVGLVRPAPG